MSKAKITVVSRHPAEAPLTNVICARFFVVKPNSYFELQYLSLKQITLSLVSDWGGIRYNIGTCGIILAQILRIQIGFPPC